MVSRKRPLLRLLTLVTVPTAANGWLGAQTSAVPWSLASRGGSAETATVAACLELDGLACAVASRARRSATVMHKKKKRIGSLDIENDWFNENLPPSLGDDAEPDFYATTPYMVTDRNEGRRLSRTPAQEAFILQFQPHRIDPGDPRFPEPIDDEVANTENYEDGEEPETTAVVKKQPVPLALSALGPKMREEDREDGGFYQSKRPSSNLMSLSTPDDEPELDPSEYLSLPPSPFTASEFDWADELDDVEPELDLEQRREELFGGMDYREAMEHFLEESDTSQDELEELGMSLVLDVDEFLASASDDAEQPRKITLDMDWDVSEDMLQDTADDEGLTHQYGLLYSESMIEDSLGGCNYTRGWDAGCRDPWKEDYGQLSGKEARPPPGKKIWVSAVHSKMFRHVQAMMADDGVEVIKNYDDYVETEDINDMLVEEIAIYKARELHRLTGLPCITERTGFIIHPSWGQVFEESYAAEKGEDPRGVDPTLDGAYLFNGMSGKVDQLIEHLRYADPRRVCRYGTVTCFFDGQTTVLAYAEAQVDVVLAYPVRIMVPISMALSNLAKKLRRTPVLQLVKLTEEEELQETFIGGQRLREMMLKDGKVLPNRILDVSAFMNSKIDVDLMELCAEELAHQFRKARPTKILTVATTGLIIAMPIAKLLQIPVVYARKSRSVDMSDPYVATYRSTNVGSSTELLVAKRHLAEDDRVLIVDDFLSRGSAQDALLRIVGMAGAKPIGVAVLVEKVYEAGRVYLSGYDVRVESLCRVLNVDDGQISIDHKQKSGEPSDPHAASYSPRDAEATNAANIHIA